MDLANVKLIDLQTSHMKKDPTTQGMCAALEPQFRQLGEETKLCLIYSRVDELDETVLDELAWQMHVDFYDANADISVKREAIKNSIVIHRTKGTPYAVEKLISMFFGFGYIQEWFEYGGQPHNFKIFINNADVLTTKNAEFLKALETVKRKSSHLEELLYEGSFQLGDAANAPELDANSGFSDTSQIIGGAFTGIIL